MSEHEQLFPATVRSERVEPPLSRLAPARTVLHGEQVRLEPMDATLHSAALHAASYSDEVVGDVWTYTPQGPWPDPMAYTQHLSAIPRGTRFWTLNGVLCAPVFRHGLMMPTSIPLAMLKAVWQAR